MTLPTVLLILAAISTGATVIAALVALRSAREARSAIFPIVREEESIRARRARLSIFGWLALTALFLGGWLATLRLTPPSNASPIAGATGVESAPTVVTALATDTPRSSTTQPSPTKISIVESEKPSPTHTPQTPAMTILSSPPTNTPGPPTATLTTAPATNTPTQTPPPPSATPTITFTPEPPTATPTSLADAVRIPTLAPRTPAPREAKMGPIQFATDITPDIEPVNPDDVFPEDTEAIYAVYPYSGMKKGLDFTAVWYKNGVELVRDEEEWQFGDEFRSYRYLIPAGEGLYKLELYVNDSILATGLFEIR